MRIIRAESVISLLESEALKHQVIIQTLAKVTSIHHSSIGTNMNHEAKRPLFQVHCKINGEEEKEYVCDRIILATGSNRSSTFCP